MANADDSIADDLTEDVTRTRTKKSLRLSKKKQLILNKRTEELERREKEEQQRHENERKEREEGLVFSIFFGCNVFAVTFAFLPCLFLRMRSYSSF